MEKDKIFFGDGGITDTTANRIADFAKLAYTDDESYLQSLSFIDKSIETINGNDSKELSFGALSLSDVEGKIEHIGNLKALCAWLREAVSAHQRLIKEARDYSFESYLADNGIKLPQTPVIEPVLTEDEVIASFDIKKRNRYYYLEAQAATIGQFVHKNGSMDVARKEYYDKLSHPRSVIEKGADTIIYTFNPSLPKEEIEDVFYSLQQKHAAYQSELNGIKYEIKAKITDDEINKNSKFESEFKAYNDIRSLYYNQYKTWKCEEQKRVAALKIIIPNSLKDTYDSVSSYGKKGN